MSPTTPLSTQNSELSTFLFGPEPIAWVQSFFGLGHPLPFRVLSLIGDTWGILLTVGIAFWLFGRERLYAVVAIVAVGAVTKVLLSMAFHQSRPDETSGIVVYEHLQVSSFPSGHVYAAVGPWGLLYVLGCVPLAVPIALGLLVALGRIYLGTHYLGDVLGGFLFAVPLVWLFARGWPRLRDRIARLGFRFFTGLSLALVAAIAIWIWQTGEHPRRFEVLGMTLGGAIALPLEWKLVRDRSEEVPLSGRLLRLALGTAGVIGFLAWDRLSDPQALYLGVLTAGCATLWVILGVPLLVSRLAPMSRSLSLLLAACASVSVAAPAAAQAPESTFRVLVSTDLGGDPDDIQSLYRLLHYSDIMKLEGIASSVGPGAKNHADKICHWIRRVDLDQLRAQGHPELISEAEALSLVRQGLFEPGRPSPARRTEGSDLIIERAHAADPEGRGRPLWVQVWGSLTDVAQALHDDPSIADKIRIYYIGTANTRADTASYNYVREGLQDRWPDLWWIENGVWPLHSRNTFFGIHSGGDQSGEWHNQSYVVANIRGHGTTNDGEFPERAGDTFPLAHRPANALKEGDSPAMTYLLSPVLGGVGDVDDPTTPSWGGRFRHYDRARFPNYYVDLDDTEAAQYSVSRWRVPILADWKDRWDWYGPEAPGPRKLADETMGAGPAKGTLLFEDQLRGSTRGEAAGGEFVYAGGWRPTALDDRIVIRLPREIRDGGGFEMDVRSLDIPAQLEEDRQNLFWLRENAPGAPRGDEVQLMVGEEFEQFAARFSTGAGAEHEIRARPLGDNVRPSFTYRLRTEWKDGLVRVLIDDRPFAEWQSPPGSAIDRFRYVVLGAPSAKDPRALRGPVFSNVRVYTP